MKYVLLGDTHLGARNGSSRFSKHFNKFFTDVLYPYVKDNNIETIIQLGDLFDNRTNLSYKAFHACKEQWFTPLGELGVEMHVLLGNHDIYHKNTLEINSPELLLGQYDNIHVHSKPFTVGEFGAADFDLVPWICAENEEEVLAFIGRKNRAKYCAGHFEIAGFSMYRGGEALSHGLSPSIFDDYDRMFSGHYHHKSEKGNILYTGTPYEITWSDYADPKGFHVVDTDKNTVEFIENPFTIFSRVVYNNGWSGDMSSLSEKIVKLVVQEKNDLFLYDRFVDSLKLTGIYDLTIIENLDQFKDGEVNENIDLEDSTAIIDSYIDGITTNIDKQKIKTYMRSLYNEALTL